MVHETRFPDNEREGWCNLSCGSLNGAAGGMASRAVRKLSPLPLEDRSTE